MRSSGCPNACCSLDEEQRSYYRLVVVISAKMNQSYSLRIFHVVLLSCFVGFTIADPPVITQELNDEKVKEGTTIIFICRATGGTSYSWYKNSRKATNERYHITEFEDGSLLRIYKIRYPRDEADYKCVVSNDDGEQAETIGKLKIYLESSLPPGFPVITVSPPNLRVIEFGYTVTMECSATGNPIPKIFWMKDDKALKIDSRIIITDGQMKIDEATKADDGTYECYARNSVGTFFSKKTMLYVREPQYPPRLTLLPEDQEVALGQDVLLTCGAVGAPIPTVLWKKDNNDIPGNEPTEQRNMLTLTNVRESGNYTCLASSRLGVVYVNVQVTVRDPPVITQELRNEKVKEGTTIIFICRAIGGTSYSWYKNSRKATNERYEITELEDGSLLRIYQIRYPTDEADYKCVVTNDYGERAETIGKLTIYSETSIPTSFPVITVSPSVTVIKLGYSATMDCSATGSPAPQIFWMKDHQPLKVGSRIRIINGQMQIDSSTKADVGSYECYARNSVGTLFSESAMLFVRERTYPPRFTILPEDREIVPGQDVLLRCVAVGAPIPTVRWMKENIDILGNDPTTGDNVLTLKNVRESGNYTCLASNRLGVQYTTAMVTVNVGRFPPRFTILPEDQEVVSGQNVSLTCAAVGAPMPNVRWMKENIYILGNKPTRRRNVLTLTNVRESGNYTCQALSSLGVQYIKVRVTVRDPPVITQELRNQKVKEGTTIIFICRATGGTSCSWYKNSKKPTNERYEITELEDGSLLKIYRARYPRDEAKYKCVVSNDVGEHAETIGKLTIYTKTSSPPGFPIITVGPDITVVELGRCATMGCSATGNPSPEIFWMKDNRPLNIDSRISIVNGQMQINGSTKDDEGSYECYARNSVGTMFSEKAMLYIRKRQLLPRFTIIPADQKVERGQSVLLPCVAVGAPMPTVRWMKNNVRITGNAPIEGSNVVTLTNVQESGSYTCVASSLLGENYVTVQVTVRDIACQTQSHVHYSGVQIEI